MRALNFGAKPLTVGTKTFNATSEPARVHAGIKLTVSEVEVGATMDFEQTTRANGTKVIKLALTAVSFKLGDPDDPSFAIDQRLRPDLHHEPRHGRRVLGRPAHAATPARASPSPAR